MCQSVPMTTSSCHLSLSLASLVFEQKNPCRVCGHIKMFFSLEKSVGADEKVSSFEQFGGIKS